MILHDTTPKWNNNIRQPLPLTDVCISGVTWKAAWLGISPARQSLSDRRINSSHGNNIFIFQGQRFSSFPSSCQRVENISWVNTPSVRLWKKKEGTSARWRVDGLYIKPSGKRSWNLWENQRAINNSFNQISRANIPCRRASQQPIRVSWCLVYTYCWSLSPRGTEKLTAAATDEKNIPPKVALGFLRTVGSTYLL